MLVVSKEQKKKVLCSATKNRCADEVQPEFSQWADNTINCSSCFIWPLANHNSV